MYRRIQTRPNCIHSPDFISGVRQGEEEEVHRRRIKTREKAKVVAAI